MTAAIIPLSGLHGANLEAYQAAGAIVAAGMDRQAEALLRDMRKLLAYANHVWPLDLEVADAFVARASNRLAAAILLSERAS